MSPDPIYAGFVVPVCDCSSAPCSSHTSTWMASEQRPAQPMPQAVLPEVAMEHRGASLSLPALTFSAHHCRGFGWLCGEKITSRAVCKQHTKNNHFILAVVLG